MIVLAWRNKTLEVNSSHIQPISGIQITKDSEVKESKNGKQAYVKMTNAKANNVQLEVPLIAAAGVDVRKEIYEWQSLVDGVGGNMYFAGQDLLGCKMILTGCQIAEMQFASSGRISAAKMALNFQQTEEAKKKKNSDANGNFIADMVQIVTTTAAVTVGIISGAVSYIADVINNAKNQASPFPPQQEKGGPYGNIYHG